MSTEEKRRLAKKRPEAIEEETATRLVKKRPGAIEEETSTPLVKVRPESVSNDGIQNDIPAPTTRKEKDDTDYTKFMKTTNTKKKNKMIPLILIVLGLVAFYAYNTSKNNSKASEDTTISEETQANNESSDIVEDSNDNIEEDNSYMEADEEEFTIIDTNDMEADEEEFTTIDTNSINDVYNDTSKYFISDSNTRFLDESELNQYSKKDLAYIRNEIYARKGYVFNLDEYKNYFENKDWYVPNINVKDDLSDLNTYERENVKLILELENR